jgi:hypothetical protein
MLDAKGMDTNGGPAKRKVRESLTRPSYADAETSEDDDKPLVWTASTVSPIPRYPVADTFCRVSVGKPPSHQPRLRNRTLMTLP